MTATYEFQIRHFAGGVQESPVQSDGHQTGTGGVSSSNVVGAAVWCVAVVLTAACGGGAGPRGAARRGRARRGGGRRARARRGAAATCHQHNASARHYD